MHTGKNPNILQQAPLSRNFVLFFWSRCVVWWDQIMRDTEFGSGCREVMSTSQATAVHKTALWPHYCRLQWKTSSYLLGNLLIFHFQTEVVRQKMVLEMHWESSMAYHNINVLRAGINFGPFIQTVQLSAFPLLFVVKRPLKSRRGQQHSHQQIQSGDLSLELLNLADSDYPLSL